MARIITYYQDMMLSVFVGGEKLELPTLPMQSGCAEPMELAAAGYQASDRLLRLPGLNLPFPSVSFRFRIIGFLIN